eukprot:CAMPEP_0119511912 /NCGR_PEP_ID=MMETSP1344-20130328/30433_1 /TAXON_ID=236787 /ORGANISM="Florenciella parvula, Strain CCMP2471" /LENGTH=60 /DNA_ID=CAMNT_0007548969 /DNA_START=118 /DNA_END=297 /DNA_ORIENTATION=-
MGGHKAWRKRVASGETAKGAGGAMLRHSPHLHGAPTARKGGASNPKKKGRRGGGGGGAAP